MPGLARYVVGRGWLHLSLLTCVGIFLLPFVWMIATSFKTDQELLEPGWFGSLPRFVSTSPYVLPAAAIDKPVAVEQQAWEQMLPLLHEQARSAARQFLDSRSDLVIDREAQVESASAALVNRLASRLDASLWASGQSRMLDAIRTELTGGVVADAVEGRLARLELRGLTVGMLDAHRVTLHDDRNAMDLWTVTSGDARLVRGGDGAVFLEYRFSSPQAEPIVLECPIRVDRPRTDWHNVNFSFKPDNSWHRIDATLVVEHETWTSTRTSWIAQTRPMTAMFQFPSFEDDTLKERTWVPMKLQGQGASGKGQASYNDPGAASSRPSTPTAPSVLRLTIHPSSTPRAVLGKVQFNYARAFRSVPFWKYLGNSLLLVALITLGTLFSSTFVAYAFARLRWPGRGVALVLMLSTMMLPAQVTMVPTFVIWRELGWYNTLNPLWVPAFFGSAFFIFLMTQHMKTIPRELEEAARIDGLTSIQTWWYVIVPLVKPAAAAIAIMTVMAAWNEFMGPLIYLRDQARFPLSLGLFAIRLDAANDWTMIMAGNVIMTLPMIVMFIVFQRYFIHGMTMGGVKG
jgi:ABC-type glycerol-3-phosphate transport system permease component